MIENWLVRHEDPRNFALHLVGVPMTAFGVGVFLAGWSGAGALLFAAGYAIQFAGHRLEGNDAGEAVILKRLLGLPYVSIANARPALYAPGRAQAAGKTAKARAAA